MVGPVEELPPAPPGIPPGIPPGMPPAPWYSLVMMGLHTFSSSFCWCSYSSFSAVWKIIECHSYRELQKWPHLRKCGAILCFHTIWSYTGEFHNANQRGHSSHAVKKELNLVPVQPGDDFVALVDDGFFVLGADLVLELLILYGALHVKGQGLQGVLGCHLVSLGIILSLELLRLMDHFFNVFFAQSSCEDIRHTAL